MVLCRQTFGAGVVTAVMIVSTARRPVVAAPDPELAIPQPPAGRQPISVDPAREARDQAEVAAMHEQMRQARERALREAGAAETTAGGGADR